MYPLSDPFSVMAGSWEDRSSPLPGMHHLANTPFAFGTDGGYQACAAQTNLTPMVVVLRQYGVPHYPLSGEIFTNLHMMILSFGRTWTKMGLNPGEHFMDRVWDALK